MDQTSAHALNKSEGIEAKLESDSEVERHLNFMESGRRKRVIEDFEIISSITDRPNNESSFSYQHLSEKLARPEIASDLSMYIDASHDSLSRQLNKNFG